MRQITTDILNQERKGSRGKQRRSKMITAAIRGTRVGDDANLASVQKWGDCQTRQATEVLCPAAISRGGCEKEKSSYAEQNLACYGTKPSGRARTHTKHLDMGHVLAQ
eukprot:GFKZ01001107.1.p1 GENE.GFKZ01001107.1~~GFKZ01001107.1.p1  ORF type:complete len:108 (-),score=8.92 GFKZ01001107.1:604-927(-)